MVHSFENCTAIPSVRILMDRDDDERKIWLFFQYLPPAMFIYKYESLALEREREREKLTNSVMMIDE